MVFVSRLLPFVAGASSRTRPGSREMPFLRFISFATLGSIVWITGLGVLGRAVGSDWQHWRHNLEYVDYAAVALLVAAIVYLIVRRVRGGSGDAAGRGRGSRLE